jgi:hypothetical protein
MIEILHFELEALGFLTKIRDLPGSAFSVILEACWLLHRLPFSSAYSLQCLPVSRAPSIL